MGKEASQVVCPGALWAGGPSFYRSSLVLSPARLGTGRIDGGGQPAEMGAGLHGFALDLFWGLPPIFHLHIKSLSG